ncbi:hypothetical protein [uncultured Methylobacterium sp.]|uniref:hypothetical protein n=1 Tax=uncultured Methylobacterium sp. TaxID=157278 RepID=UPI0035CAAB9D
MTRVFAVPALIAVLTVAGLLSALLVEEIGQPVSWLALTVPLLILAWCVCRFAMKRR